MTMARRPLPHYSSLITRHSQRGQAAVELAFALPVLCFVVFGVLDLGRAFSYHVMLANAAREAARYCALHPGDTAGTRARALAELDGKVPVNTASTTCGAVGAGNPVTVTVSAVFSPVTPLISSFAGSALTITAPATMVAFR